MFDDTAAENFEPLIIEPDFQLETRMSERKIGIDPAHLQVTTEQSARIPEMDKTQ